MGRVCPNAHGSGRYSTHTHTLLKGRDNTDATIASMTNCYTPIHNKYTSLKYIFLHGKIHSVPIPRAKKELLDALRYWLSEILSAYFTLYLCLCLNYLGFRWPKEPYRMLDKKINKKRFSQNERFVYVCVCCIDQSLIWF